MLAVLSAPYMIALVIIAISFLGTGYTGHLTWKECLRLFVIQSGLILCYFRFGKALISKNHAQQPILANASIILALCIIFVLTQFDPATSAIAFGNPQDRFNLFFIITSVLVFISGGAYFFNHWRQLRWQSFILLDRVVVGLVAGILAISIASQILSGIVVKQMVLFTAKILSYLFVWFLITRSFDAVSETARNGWLGQIETKRWMTAFWCLMILFGVALVNGVFRTGKVVNYYYLSQEALEQRNWEDAEGYFTMIQKMNATVDLRFIHDRMINDLAVIYLEKGEEGKAQGLIRSLKEDVTYSEQERYNKVGQIYFRAQKWSRAIPEYEGLLQAVGKDLDVLDKVGIAYTRLQDIQGFLDIVSEYQYMPKVNAQTYEEVLFLGNINFYRKNYEEARRYLERASSEKPFDAYAIYKVGRVYLELKQIQRASAQFLKAISIEPDFADAHYRLGVCYEKQNRREDAVEMYKKTIVLLPNHREGLLALGRMMKVMR